MTVTEERWAEDDPQWEVTPPFAAVLKFNPNHDAQGRFATTEFDSWFAGSKTVDDKGNPLVFYRGTMQEPDPTKTPTLYGRATPSFTLDPYVADVYSRRPGYSPQYVMGGSDGKGGSTVGIYHLALKNPLDLRKAGMTPTLAAVGKAMGGLSGDDASRIVKDLLDNRGRGGFKVTLPGWDNLTWFVNHLKGKSWQEIESAIKPFKVDAYGLADSGVFTEIAKQKGFDSIVHKDVFEGGAPYYKGNPSALEKRGKTTVIDTYRPFQQNQIKARTNARPTDHDDVTKSALAVLKFNAHHDAQGRFTDAENATFVSIGERFDNYRHRDVVSLKSPGFEEFAKESKEYLEYHATPGEQAGVRSYTGEHYGQVNQQLRYGTASTSPITARVINQLDSLFSHARLTRNLLVTREMTDGTKTATTLKQMMDAGRLKYGTRFVEKAFLSTTLDKSTSEFFGGHGGVAFHLDAPKGLRGLYVEAMADHNGEHEVLMARGTTIKVRHAEWREEYGRHATQPHRKLHIYGTLEQE